MSDYSNRNDKEDSSYCSKCNLVSDEILMLTCDHNLCLQCAAKSLFKDTERLSKNRSSSKYQSIQCEICGNQTALDPSTTEELYSYRPENFNTSNARIKVYFI